MNLSELRDLDYNNIYAWPTPVKVGAAVILFALIVGLAGWFVIKPVYEELGRAESQEQQLRATFEEKQEKAANLEEYRQQLEEMREIYGAMLRQLPSKTEMPDLLVDISQTALASGIENELFRPGNETVRQFYAELPIDLRMIGGYHNFGDFISGVASLPRIVILTMHDIALQPTDQQNRPGQLVLEGTAKTYRYVEEDESLLQEEEGGGS